MKLIKKWMGKEVNKKESDSCEILVKNPINVEDIYQYDNDSVIVKYRNGIKEKFNGFNLLQDTHGKNKFKLKDIIKTFSFDPMLIEEVTKSDKDKLEIGCIFLTDDGEMIKITDKSTLNEVVKNYFIISIDDIISDGSCVFYAPLKNDMKELIGGYKFVNYSNMNITYDPIKGALIDAISAGNGVYYENAANLMKSYPFTITAVYYGVDGVGGYKKNINTTSGHYDGIIMPINGRIWSNNYINVGLQDGQQYFLALVIDENGHPHAYAQTMDGNVIEKYRSDITHIPTYLPHIGLGSQQDNNGIPNGKQLSKFYLKNLRIFNRALSTDELKTLADADKN